MRRAILVAALAGALACGKASRSSTPACVPSDCAAAGATCGPVGDGCGSVIECGACAAGEICGGGGKPNVCGKGVCQATTCQALGASCGSIGDGCGGILSCGECAAGETCGAGEPNVCAKAPACAKTTCAARNADCGTMPDGCGGELACGECRAGDACGAGGTPNVCAPIPPTGNVGWSFAVSSPGPDYALGAGNDSAGNRYLLSFTLNDVGTTHVLRLQKLAPDGKLAWTKEWTAEGYAPWASSFRMAVTPAGSIYVTASAECFSWEMSCTRRVDFGGGAATDSMLVKLGADGSFEWQRELTTSAVASLATNEQGSALVARLARDSGRSRIEKYQHDGALLAKLDDVLATAVALDPSGNMIVAVHGSVAKYSAAGTLLWSKDLPGSGGPIGVATTAKGTVVELASRIGDVTFGPSQVRSGPLVLYVIEPDARPRFARGITGGMAFLAVDPTGRAAVVQGGNCGEIVVEAFDLSNADLWRRFLPDAARCWAGMGTGPAAYGADHRLFVTGNFGQVVEIGGKTWTPRGLDAIGVLLDP